MTTSSEETPLQVLSELHLGVPLGQFRAAPLSLGPGEPRAVAALFGEDAEIDPFIAMFFFPKHTLKMIVFDETGREHWRRDLGPGVVPGVWFAPIFPFDLDGDGIDEIYHVINTDPEHPLKHWAYCLERVDPRTGAATGQWPFPQPHRPQIMSHTYRHFLFGGRVRGEPVLVAGQGTYGPMTLRAFNPDMTVRWETAMNPEEDGLSMGSHVTPVVDIDGDGSDEFFWGERCIRLDTGEMLFCCDHGAWREHSDIVQPVLDYETGRWRVFTIREYADKEPPRVVLFDDRGDRVWADVDEGHMDTGWVARTGANREPIALAVKVGAKIRDEHGERRTGVVEYAYDAFSGQAINLPFRAYTSIPVDLDGDGRHEFVRGYFEGDGAVVDRDGREIGNIGGLAAMNCRFTSKPGEQILGYSPDGTVRIWHDPGAEDSEAALARYAHPFYQANMRQTGNGYNLFTLGGV